MGDSGFHSADSNVDKSFESRTEAEAFVAGKHVRTDDEPSKFYAVAVGTPVGIYTNWAEAQEAITGVKGPKFRKFSTRPEAAEYIRTFGGSAGIAALKASGDWTDTVDPMNTLVKDDFDDDELLAAQLDIQAVNAGDMTASIVNIYTDGSSRGNGKAGARAGLGVFFGRNDPRNICERLQGEPQTNQRAELMAVQRALEIVPPTQSVRICTDSKYTINCLRDWITKWRRDEWKSATGADVKNRDIIEPTADKIEQRRIAGGETLFQWVKGHEKSAGNIAADALAVRGASMA
jgi:ribonuclease HI